MTIRYRKDRDRYVIDVTVGNERHRPSCKTREEAELIQQELIEKDKLLRAGITPIHEAIRQYMAECSVDKATGDSEKRWFQLANRFFEEQKLGFLHEVKPRHLVALQKWLQKDQQFHLVNEKNPDKKITFKHEAYKPSSVNRVFATYKDFFRWCAINEMRDGSPGQLVRQLPVKDPEVVPITDVEFERYYELCHQPENLWFWPCSGLIYYTGMRPSSVENLQVKHLQFDQGRIVWTTRKGYAGGEEEFHFPLLMPGLVTLLRDHLANLSSKGLVMGPEAYVFVDENLRPLSADRISKVGNRLFRKAGIKAKFYSFRHKLAGDVVRVSKSLEDARKLLGHKDIRTTMKYLPDTSMEHLNRSLESVRSTLSVVGQNAVETGNLAQEVGAFPKDLTDRL